MKLAEYEHMAKIYAYVYSTPANSPERLARLAELSEEDSTALYDFDMGTLSGRIKKPKNQVQESEVSAMNEEKKIRNYEDYKKALGRSRCYKALVEFKRSNPALYAHYQERFEKEKAR